MKAYGEFAEFSVAEQDTISTAQFARRMGIEDVNYPPSQILDNLYLGSEGHAASLDLLKKAGISHVLNCAIQVELHALLPSVLMAGSCLLQCKCYLKPEMEYHHLHIYDLPSTVLPIAGQ